MNEVLVPMKQQGNAKILIILVVLAILGGLYWWNKKSAVPYTAVPTKQVESGIQNDNELMSASKDLDSEDIDGPIDNELSQNDAESF